MCGSEDARVRGRMYDFRTSPTLKIKRNAVEAAYEPELDAWYASGDRVVWQ